MADVAGKEGENDDLDMECVDEAPTLNQINNIPESSKIITTIQNQLLLLMEKIKKPRETVEMSVTNQDGFQELNSTFVKPDGIVKSIPFTVPPVSIPSPLPVSVPIAAPVSKPVTAHVSKPQVVPRIQSVTSLAPKVIQQPVIQQGNITYRMVPLLNQNTPVSSQAVQGIDYRYVLPTQPQQTLVTQPITKPSINQSVIIPTNPLLVQPVNASAPLKVSYQTIAHVNKPQTSTAIGRTINPAEVSRPTESLRDDSGNLIELIYYGSKQGNLSFGQSRGNFTFKCGQCQKILASNILYMKHIKEHFEALRLKNKQSSNLECEHCFKAFPFIKDLQTHKEKVHFNSVYRCKFCEYSFPDKTALMTHLGKKHKPLQMPYVCKLCGYMTSIYQDVIQHFEKSHDRTKFILCHLCLKVMADVRNFFKHCQMHYQSSNLSKGHCRSCKLIFLNSQDFRDHAAKEHIVHSLSDRTLAPKPTSKRQLPQIPTQSPSRAPAKKSKTIDNTPSTTQSTALSFAKCVPEFQGPLRCCECGARANIQNHFRKHVLKCRRCCYQTYCQRSYSSHSNIFHSNQRSPPVLHPIEKIYNRTKTTVTLRCKRCFFTTQSASFMAWHVVICPKGSSIVESFCYRKNTAVVSQPKKVIVNSDDPIVIDDSDDEDKSKSNAPTTSKNAIAVNGVH